MNFFLALGWLSWFLLGTAPAAPPVSDFEIRFQIKNAGLSVEGTLSGLTADVKFDPAHPERGTMQATVPVNTIQTGITLRDRHLQKPDYFDAEKYPTITLQSKAFRQTAPGKYMGTFDLTMKGITHEVTVPFAVSAAHEFHGQFEVNRLAYNLGKSSLMLSDNVTVSLRAKLDN